MDRKAFTEMVKKYVAGRASKREKAFLEAYDKQFDKAKTIPTEQWPVEHVDQSYSGAVERINERYYRRVRKLRAYRITAAAAAVMITISLSYYFRNAIRNVVDPEIFHKQRVAYGNIGRMTLPDGTKVVLNAGSTLQYSSRFNERDRKVFLDGEGYFEVTKNTDKPFTVEVRRLAVQVLGTAFNVSAYADDDINEVEVLSGKVAVQAIEGQKSTVLLSRHEGIRLDTTLFELSRIAVDSNLVRSWEHGVLDFKGRPLSAVARSLERYYGTKITLDNSLSDTPVHARVEGELSAALKALAKALDATVHHRDGHYFINTTRQDSK